MSLAHASTKLIKVLERYASVLKQERVIMPQKDMLERKMKIEQLIYMIKQMICKNISTSTILNQIEEVLEHVHKVCMCDNNKIEHCIPPQNPLLIQHKNRKIVLSKNIPKPQVDFKDRDSKYTLTEEREEKTYKHFPLTEQDAQKVYNLALEMNTNTNMNIDVCYSVKYICTKEDLDKANEEILKESVIGVDIQKHTFRSYKGFLCYMQVSTKTQIYIFDMLSLRSHSQSMYFLQSENIYKVMHKMYSKRYWIEKDMKCIVPKAIDIDNLANTLFSSPSSQSLVQLVKRYLKVEYKRELDLFDWRYRPITREVHKHLVDQVLYLLPLLCKVAQDLSSISFCQRLCAQTDVKFSSDTASEFAKKYGIKETPILIEIFLLRQFIAKQEDESPHFVMTDRQLLLLIESHPETPAEIFSLFPKTSSLFKANMNNFLRALRPSASDKSFSIDGLKKAK